MIGYARGNIRAVVDALIPRTPSLEESHGKEHVPGGLDVDLDIYLIESFNQYQEHNLGFVSKALNRIGIKNMPYAFLVAVLLDIVALELIAKRANDESVKKLSISSPFKRLSRTDRLRAIDLLENGSLDTLASKTSQRAPMIGTVRFLALGINTFPLLGYYSEWPSNDPEKNPAWQQIQYPGPRDGYSAHMGYEVEEFRE